MDEITASKRRLDFGRILVQTSLVGIINMLIKIKINDSIFTISVAEEATHFNCSSGKEAPSGHSFGSLCSGCDGRRDEAKARISSLPASGCDTSGEEDDGASVGFQGVSDSAPESMEECMPLQKGKKTWSQEELQENFVDSSKKEGMCGGVEMGPSEINTHGHTSGSLSPLGPQADLLLCDAIPNSTFSHNQARILSQSLDQVAGPSKAKLAEISNGSGESKKQSIRDKKWGTTMGRKVRKMKKLILAESDGFFDDMESEADQLAQASDKARNSTRRNTRKEKRRRNTRLRTSLESVSHAGISHTSNSRDSNYFVDCRKKWGAEVEGVRQEAEDIWKIGNELGVEARSEERRITEKLVEMECRDREALLVPAQAGMEAAGSGSKTSKLDEDS